MRNRYISFKNKISGKHETFNYVVDIYKKYDPEKLGITYHALMNALAKDKKYQNNKIVIVYRERVKTEWK